MKSRIIDLIRKVLIKTWLPLKQKKDEIASKIKFSIIKKITFIYFKNLLISGIIFFGIFQLLYIMMIRESYDAEAKKLISEFEQLSQWDDIDGIFEKYKLSSKESIIYAEMRNGNTKEIMYTNVPEEISVDYKKKVAGGIYFGEEDEDGFELIILNNKVAGNVFGEYELTLYYDMTRQYKTMYRLMWYMAGCYAVVLLFVSYEGMKSSARLFTPIKEISEAAGRLTVNNLGSERLNVEGTKDELKELAVVINDMLDRMDTSYESQKQFVSDASHELRTPIAVIQGYVNMLDRWGAKDPDILAESIEALKNEASSMQDLVEKLLFLSRHDKKTLKLKKQRFDAAEIIDEIYKETQMVAKERNIECTAHEKVYIYGDRQSIKQAVRVFVDNAVKYSREGDSIRLSCKNDNGDCVIEISDTGIGMKKKDLDNIFSRFYRADDVRGKNIDGHGLGLSIARLIINAHAGRINIKTQYTKGTSFKITFPKLWYAAKNYYDVK